MDKKYTPERIAILRSRLGGTFAREALRCIMNRFYGFRLSEKGMADVGCIHEMLFPNKPVPETEQELADVLTLGQCTCIDIECGVNPIDTLSDEQIVQLWIMLNVDSHEWYDFFPQITEALKHG